jgi:hypothetical protein
VAFQKPGRSHRRVIRQLRLWLVLLIAVCPEISRGAAIAEHVVVIGLDGCRPAAIQQAAGPVLKELWGQGAWSWSARAVLPTVTQVNFPSMLTSSLPEKHGISSKEWTTGMRPKVEGFLKQRTSGAEPRKQKIARPQTRRRKCS